MALIPANLIPKKSKLFWRLFNVIIVTIAIVGLACSDGIVNDYYYSNFTPETVAQDVEKPFFYSNLAYYKINHDDQHIARFHHVNIQEWYDYFNKSIPKSELETYLYIWDVDKLNKFFNALKNPGENNIPAYANLELYKQKPNDKAMPFLNYLLIARACEQFSTTTLDWFYQYDENGNPIQEKKKEPLVDIVETELLKNFESEKDPFIKERYWFQLVRYYFFHPDKDGYAQSKKYFDTHKASFPKNNMYYRTMGYAAGAYYKTKNYAQANYFYSLIYANNLELKIPANFSFHPQDEEDWKACLALAQSDEERIVLWQLLGYYYDPKRAIEEIVKINPQSPYLDLLYTRLINIQEQNYLTYKATNTDLLVKNAKSIRTNAYSDEYGDYVPPIDFWEITRDSIQPLVNTQKFIAELAKTKNIRKPYTLEWAAGYFSWLVGDYKDAQLHYDLAGSLLPTGNELINAQHKIFLWMNELAQIESIDEQKENEIFPKIKWLETVAINELRKESAWAYTIQQLSAIYKKQKSVVKAECLIHSDSFYVDNNKVETMKEFILRPNKTSLEKFLVDLYPITIDDIYTYEGVLATYNQQYDKAIYHFKQSPEIAYDYLPANPFNIHINDCHDCDHRLPQTTNYSRMSFVAKLKEMEDKIASGEDVYNNAFLLGNAYYNITHYGNSRMFYECKIIGFGHYSPFAIDKAFRNNIVNNAIAEKYYLLAKANTTDPEKQAKMTFMAAKCENNKIYNQRYYLNEKGDPWEIEYSMEEHFRIPKGKYYEELKNNYANTNYVKEVIGECGYFKSYMKK